MSRVRDRIVAIGAFLVLVALASAVVALVLDAQRSGIETREDFRLEQVQTEAARMDTRVQQAFASFTSVYGSAGAFTMQPNDPADAARITPQDPEATSGVVLVDVDGTIVNGSLLRDPDVIGSRLERRGLDAVLAG